MTVLLENPQRDWLEIKDSEDGWTALVCQCCGNLFHGWKFKVKCFVCAVPAFPQHVRHITHVAVRFAGQTYSLPAPNRHHNVLRVIHAAHKKTWPNIQGFLDNRGKFLGRREAVRVALKARQVLKPDDLRGHRLFSEDLW